MGAQSVDDVNRLALMAAAGIEDEQAAEKLRLRVAIIAQPGRVSEAMAAYTRQLLERTVHVVDEASADIEVIIGSREPTGERGAIGVSISSDAITFGLGCIGEVNVEERNEPPKLLLKIASCYLAGYVIAKLTATERFSAVPTPFTVSAKTVGFDYADLSRKIVFGRDSVLVGGGGVANGFLWALEDLDVSGQLYISDPKVVSESNLNRCLYFEQEDLNKPKVEVLAKKALQGKVDIVPHHGEFRELVKQLGRVRRAYTTVDSRRVRRGVRNELPLEILDASTTDTSEVVVFSERQPTSLACLSCIYAHIPAETQREQHIADALGLHITDVQMSIINEDIANRLAKTHPSLEVEKIKGMAFDSLFREMCGAGTLLSSPAKQVLAPLGFISNLAGCLLALELLRFESACAANAEFNYMALDPWRPPHRRARLSKPAKDDCEFCGELENREVLESVWQDVV
ncbi:ThiF family adenylyltransferase [Burkholderia cepacia]|uniref:ThiF family adenylyltransferase n=1 Tax=Burkholderia cepacia TaxID=292 RepID=UPI001CF188CB|nr:ThiF family adenylyltransferase [Burkholderia cepacia]MCA8219097.1 ThiF family adenylyltransferase [Burkholderia cepacia]